MSAACSEPRAHRRFLAHHVPVREKALDEDDVERAVTQDLVGDVEVAVPGVADRRHGVRHPGKHSPARLSRQDGAEDYPREECAA
jgi:hypothetical protein